MILEASNLGFNRKPPRNLTTIYGCESIPCSCCEQAKNVSDCFDVHLLNLWMVVHHPYTTYGCPPTMETPPGDPDLGNRWVFTFKDIFKESNVQRFVSDGTRIVSSKLIHRDARVLTLTFILLLLRYCQPLHPPLTFLIRYVIQSLLAVMSTTTDPQASLNPVLLPKLRTAQRAQALPIASTDNSSNLTVLQDVQHPRVRDQACWL